jgi:tripartite-type tricarboxylate transporter receptor subunit TctC
MRLILCILFLFATPSLAVSYPERPIRLVVPLAAGTTPDVQARFLAQFLSQDLGTPVVVINKPGAAGEVAGRYVAQANPDGYTLLASALGFLVIQPLIDGVDIPLEPIATVFDFETFLVARADRFASMEAVIAEGCQDHMTFGSMGVGTVPYMEAKIFQKQHGIAMQFIPYTAIGPMLADLKRGDIHTVFVAGPAILSIRNDPQFNKLKVGEPAWSILVGPVGLPSVVIKRLEQAMEKFSSSAISRQATAIWSTAHVRTGPSLKKFLIESRVYWKNALDSK